MKEPITILTIFGGRWNCLTHYLEGLMRLDYPKELLDIVWFSNASDVFADALRIQQQVLEEKGYKVRFYHDRTHPPSYLVSQEVNGYLGVNSAYHHLNNIAACYNAAWQYMETEYVLINEDDIIPPSHVLKKFLFFLETNRKAAMIMGSMNVRHNGHFQLLNVMNWIPISIVINGKVRTRLQLAQVEKPYGIQKVVTGHTGLNLINRSRCPKVLMRKYPFRAVSKWKEIVDPQGMDMLFGIEITKSGAGVYCDFETRPFHINSAGHFV